MNKNEFVRAVSETIGKNEGKAPTLKDTEKFVNGVLETIATQMVKGEKIAFTGFGSFEIAERAAREGRNPKDGSTIAIPASKTVKFRPSSVLKAAMNE